MPDDDFDFSDIKFTDEKLDPDPTPKTPPKKTPPKSTPKAATRGRPTKSSQIAELQEEIEGFLLMLGMPLKMRDMHYDGSSCADLFFTVSSKGLEVAPESKQLAFALAQVGVDNKYIKKFFSMGDETAKWLMLAQALQPFAFAAYGHVAARRIPNGVGESSVA